MLDAAVEFAEMHFYKILGVKHDPKNTYVLGEADNFGVQLMTIPKDELNTSATIEIGTKSHIQEIFSNIS